MAARARPGHANCILVEHPATCGKPAAFEHRGTWRRTTATAATPDVRYAQSAPVRHPGRPVRMPTRRAFRSAAVAGANRQEPQGSILGSRAARLGYDNRQIFLNLGGPATPTTLRPVKLSDIPLVAVIRAQEWETETFWTGRIGLYLSGEHSPQQALPARAAFVALDGTELVGFVAGHRTGRFGCDGELQWINVAKGRRGQGIANRLIVKIGAWFVEQDASRVCVNVQPKNTAARRFYRRCGAQPLNEHWMIWADSRTMCAGADV